MIDNKNSNSLENRILEKIKEDKLKPTSFWYFLIKDYSLWISLGLAILLGSFAVAPIIFIFSNLELGYVKHLATNPFVFVLITLPYFWILLTIIAVYFAKLFWSNTKTGYKFQGRTVVISSVVTSLLLGAVLNYWNFGQALDDGFHSESMGYYKNLETRKNENWFNPHEGRLIGIVSTISTSSFTIKNEINNFTEEVFFDESIPGAEFVDEDNKIRVIGFQNDGTDFLACAIFPDNFRPGKIASTTRAQMKQKMQQILNIHPECKSMLENGRANFRSNNNNNNNLK